MELDHAQNGLGALVLDQCLEKWEAVLVQFRGKLLADCDFFGNASSDTSVWADGAVETKVLKKGSVLQEKKSLTARIADPAVLQKGNIPQSGDGLATQ